MADPNVQSASDRLTVEEAIAKVIARQNLLYEEGRKVRAGTATTDETKRLETEITTLTSKVRDATNTNTSFSRSVEDVGTSSNRATTTVRDNSGAVSQLTEATAKAVGELFKYREELQKISEGRYAFVTNIAGQIGGSSRLYAKALNDVTDFNSEMARYDDNNAERVSRIVEYYENLDDLVQDSTGKMTRGQMEFVGQIGIGNKAFASAQYAAREFYGQATGFRKDENNKIVPDGFFRIQGVPIEDVFGSVEAAFQPLSDLLRDETLSLSIAEKMSDKQGADDMVRDTVRMSTAIKAFGMSSAEVTELVRTNYIMTGKAGTDYFNDLTKASMLGEKAFGYSSQMIISDITKMSNSFEVFGYRAPEELAKISAAAHDAHMSISDLQGVMGKFNTFESAAGAVSQLNSALGTNFDAIELMTLKFDDPAMMIQRLREGFMSAGKTFEEIPAAYRTMITQELSITTEALRGLLDGSIRDIDTLTQQQESANKIYEASGTSDAERQRAMDESIKSRVRVTGDAIKQAGDMVAQAERAAERFANTSNTYISRVNDIGDAINGVSTNVAGELLPKMNELIETATTTYSKLIMGGLQSTQQKLVSDTIDNLKSFLDKLTNAIEQFKKDNPGFAFEAVKVPEIERPKATPRGAPESAEDMYVSPGGSTIVTANYGELNQKSFILDKRDEVIARPPPEPAPNVATKTPVSLPAVSDAIRASLQGVGTSLRIELDVGQLTDLVLRDIMMNKPNVFGGVG